MSGKIKVRKSLPKNLTVQKPHGPPKGKKQYNRRKINDLRD